MNEEEGDLISEVAFGYAGDYDAGAWIEQRNLSRDSLEYLAETIVAQCFDRTLEEAGIKDLLIGEGGESQIRYIGKDELEKILEALNNGLIGELAKYLQASIGFTFHVGYTVAERQLQVGSYQPDEETGQPPK